MGYTHYWRREKEIDIETFKKIVKDFRILISFIRETGIELADFDGLGYPAIDMDEICFNGFRKCGHAENSKVSIPWPSDNAAGVQNFKESTDGIVGHWFAGATLETRVCNGDCSYESVTFCRILDLTRYDEPQLGKYFDCCKTGYRPYDVAVTALLIIAKHYLKDKIIVTSDGGIQHWHDAMNLCNQHLRYGFDFKLDEKVRAN